MHKFGVALTIVLLIVGFWDVRELWESEMFHSIAMPLAGLLVLIGGMKFALDRSS